MPRKHPSENQASLKEGDEYLKKAYTPGIPAKPHYVAYMDRAEAGLQKVKIIVFFGMTAFIITAILGYYLIFKLSRDSTEMASTMRDMAQSIKLMHPMSDNMAQMNQSLLQMNESTNRMQYSVGHMDRTYTKPMNVLNRFMPWGGEPTYRPTTPFVPFPQPQNRSQNNGPEQH
jgi:methyl-accepting chemotaxis protein